MVGICKFFNYDRDPFGEDIGGTESDESTDYDSEDEYDDDFSVEDLDMYPPSPVPNSGGIVLKLIESFLVNPSSLRNNDFPLLFFWVAFYQWHACHKLYFEYFW